MMYKAKKSIFDHINDKCNEVTWPVMRRLISHTDRQGARNFRRRVFRRRIFDVGIFAVRIFRRTKFSPYGIFAFRNFRRKEFSPYGSFAIQNFAVWMSGFLDFHRIISIFWFNSTDNCVFHTFKKCKIPIKFCLF